MRLEFNGADMTAIKVRNTTICNLTPKFSVRVMSRDA